MCFLKFKFHCTFIYCLLNVATQKMAVLEITRNLLEYHSKRPKASPWTKKEDTPKAPQDEIKDFGAESSFSLDSQLIRNAMEETQCCQEIWTSLLRLEVSAHYPQPVISGVLFARRVMKSLPF
jgi:hypothetical protein